VCPVLLTIVVHPPVMPIRVYIPGLVTVTTSESLARTAVAVTARAWRDDNVTAEREFTFCIAHPRPLAAKLNWTGWTGSVIGAAAVLQSDGDRGFSLVKTSRSTSTE
jgi:hypothetical protein